MRRLKHIFLAAVLSAGLTQQVSGQLESLSDAQIPCDKVFAVDGDVIVGTGHDDFFRPVRVFARGTGELISEIDKRIKRFVSDSETAYFLLLDDDFDNYGHLYTLRDQSFEPAAFQNLLHEIYYDDSLQALVGFTGDGMALFYQDGGVTEITIGQRVLSLTAYNGGFMAVSDSSFHLLDSELSLLNSSPLPDGLKSFQGVNSNGILLLSPEVDFYNDLRPTSLFNIGTSELYAVVDPNGNEMMLEPFVVPKGIAGNHFFLSGSGQVSAANSVFPHPTDAAFIDPVTGICISANFRPGIRQPVIQPTLLYSKGGPVVFGRMGMEGVEPYVIEDTELRVLKDIYPGYGGSIDTQIWNSLNYGSFGTTVDAFSAVEDDGILYFAARSPFLGNQLRRSDGTKEGTYAISEVDRENKGFRRCFLSKDKGSILVTVEYRDESRRLFLLNSNANAVYPQLDKDRNWEVAYVRNPLFFSGTQYLENDHPGTFTAKDGSSLLILKRADLWVSYLSYNHSWIYPANFIQGFYANTLIQVINGDGSLKSSASIRAREDQTRTISRDYNSGITYVIVSHRPADTWVNEKNLMELRQGHYLIELDDRGSEIRSTFIPTGGKDHIDISRIEIGADGIYVLGMADEYFGINATYSNNIAPGFVRAVLMKFSFDHELLWISDSAMDQDVFGSGVQNLVVGENTVYIASGGTSYNVRSSCAFSNWPYQISAYRTDSGLRKWRQLLEANDITRISAMELVGDQWLWVGGYTRGDLSIGDRQLDLYSNYVDCSYNDFLLCLNTAANEVSFLAHTDPTRAKLIQGLSFHDDHLYSLSFVYEEDFFPVPIYGHQGRWNLQFDKFTNGGVKVDSLVWPTSISRHELEKRIWENKFSFDFHPEGGIILSAQNVANGTIDGFYSPGAGLVGGLNSWIIQRRNIATLEASQLRPLNSDVAEFGIYPNPLHTDAFVLELTSQDIGKYDQLIMTDINGRVVSSQNLSGPFGSRFISVDASLSNGTYLIQLTGKSNSVVKKMVLQR